MVESTTINIKTLSQSYAGMLLTHGELLQRKNVRSKQRLLQIIKLDLDKLTHALLEVKERRAWPILTRFFGDHQTLLPAIVGRLEQNVIDHLGFEIHEPLDLVLQGLNHWLTKTRRTYQCSLTMQGFLRFPASTSFQKRVGGYTEIMRLWVQVNGQTLMLELFDIHRPVDALLGRRLGKPLIHRNFDCLVTSTNINEHDMGQVESLFQGDGVWHYAFRVRDFADVKQLHEELEDLAASDSTYRLPYAAPVHNAGDGSLHTKIIHQALDLELEFIALSSHEH